MSFFFFFKKHVIKIVYNRERAKKERKEKANTSFIAIRF
jgi:hypothetical protein